MHGQGRIYTLKVHVQLFGSSSSHVFPGTSFSPVPATCEDESYTENTLKEKLDH